MNHDEAQELLGAHALDAVDGDERAALELHLAECPRCRAELAEHREVATLLAHGGADAPLWVWERIADSIDGPPPPVSMPQLTRRRRTPSWPAVAGLAAAALVAVVLGVQVRDQASQIDRLEEAMADPLAPAFAAALDDPDSEVFELTSTDGDTVVRGAVTADGDGYLRATGLPALSRDRTYQLWGASGDDLVSLGVLGSDPDVVPFRDAGYTLLAITEEDAPGVVRSSNPTVVAGTRV